MKPILCVDIDSTVWDTGSWVCAAVLEVTGETLDVEEITTWTHLLDTCGEAATTRVFDSVFDPARIFEREPYPGVSEVLQTLQERRGMRVHFVTHNDPELMAPGLKPWLEEHFGSGVELTVSLGDKLEVVGRLEAFGLIDDRPETIGRAADTGLWAATKIQPWNRDLVAARTDVFGFSDWREVPDLLPPVRGKR